VQGDIAEQRGGGRTERMLGWRRDDTADQPRNRGNGYEEPEYGEGDPDARCALGFPRYSALKDYFPAGSGTGSVGRKSAVQTDEKSLAPIDLSSTLPLGHCSPAIDFATMILKGERIGRTSVISKPPLFRSSSNS